MSSESGGEVEGGRGDGCEIEGGGGDGDDNGIDKAKLELIWTQLNTVTKAEKEAYAALGRYNERLLKTRYTEHYKQAIRRIKQNIENLKKQRLYLADLQKRFYWIQWKDSTGNSCVNLGVSLSCVTGR